MLRFLHLIWPKMTTVNVMTENDFRTVNKNMTWYLLGSPLSPFLWRAALCSQCRTRHLGQGLLECSNCHCLGLALSFALAGFQLGSKSREKPDRITDSPLPLQNIFLSLYPFLYFFLSFLGGPIFPFKLLEGENSPTLLPVTFNAELYESLTKSSVMRPLCLVKSHIR